MNFTLVDTLLWAAGPLCTAVLLFVLLHCKRYGILPCFTVWIAFSLLYSIALFSAFWFRLEEVYSVVYWTGAAIDMLLQLAVMGEIAVSVLMRDGKWVEGVQRPLAVVSLAGIAFAAGLAWWVKPSGPGDAAAAWAMRGNMFATILICVLFSAVMVLSQRFALSWRVHVMREGYGLTVWALVSFAVDALHSYFGGTRHFVPLEYARKTVYLGSLVYWAIALWLPEPSRSFTPEMLANLMDARGHILYDDSADPNPVREKL